MHLHFVASLYKIQLNAGRHFLHEHPAGATSWNDDWIQQILKHGRVSSVISDQCEYGLLTPDAQGNPAPAKKPTRWMSSSPEMIKRLSRRCSKTHVHQHLVGGRAKAAEEYPLDLICEFLRGMRDTADSNIEVADDYNQDLVFATRSAEMFHGTDSMNVAAAYRAKDVEEDTKDLSVKFKHHDGHVEDTKLVFKERYRDE